MEKPTTDKLLIVESDDALRRTIIAILSGAGYEISTDYRDGMKSVLAFSPDAVRKATTSVSNFLSRSKIAYL